MSKKQLNEVRRFMKLANLNGNITSNFIKETYGADYVREDEEIEDIDVEEEPDVGGLEDEVMGLEDELTGLEDEEGAIEDEIGGLEAEEGADAEELVLSIVNDIQQLASLAGVDVDVEADEEVEDEMDIDMDMDMDLDADDEMDIEGDIELDTEEPEEETLEEMINAILAEEDGAMAGDKKKTSGRKRGSKKGDEAYINEEEEELDEDVGDPMETEEDEEEWFRQGRMTPKQKRDRRLALLQKKTGREPPSPSKGIRRTRRLPASRPLKGVSPQQESVQVLDDEKLIQEVAKRVKQRLAKIARAQKRRRR